MSDEPNDLPYNIEQVGAHIFTGGLDFEQEVTMNNLNEALNRGEKYIMALASGDEQMLHLWEPLNRLLMGISIGALQPIIKRITDGEEPGKVLAGVMAGVSGMFFFGGVEYAKILGLDGVGIELSDQEKTVETTEGGVEYHPEEMPQGSPNLSLEDLLHRFTTENPDLGDEE